MLTHLHIRDFAIIDQLDLDIQAGMTSMTGETGAGKSILLDALGLVLGDRAEAGSVRHGAKKADITATFNIGELAELQSWLEEQDLESDAECIMRRIVTAEGRSKGYINGSPVTMQILRTVGEQLVDIHGQHEHQSLLKKDTQRQRLDDYGVHRDLLEATASTYKAWRKAKQELETLRSAEKNRAERLDLLKFQVNELDALALQSGEWNEINEEHSRLANAGKLLATAQSALDVLYEHDEQNLYQVLSQQTQAVTGAAAVDTGLSNIAEALNSAMIQLDEACGGLRDYLSELDLDPARLDWLEERMGLIHSLSRKHMCEPDALIELHTDMAAELDKLENADAALVELERQAEQLQEQYQLRARELHERRLATAEQLSSLVTEAMQGLGMDGGRLEISVEEKSDRSAAHGFDHIEFMVSANPGQPTKPLNKVASGGELSRISLAIQMITASCEKVPTLIFDEVDTGIGGGVAEVVGKHLRTLGKERQVMCVTHLPQVAAQAHNHLKVEKQKGIDTTTTGIQPLVATQRIEEIARMLGGVEITDQTRKHAEEMIDRAMV